MSRCCFLLGAAAVCLALGDLTEALILLGFATMSVAVTVVQETRTQRVLEALRDLTSPCALVIRDGDRKRIACREVAADAVLSQSYDLLIDESLLTAESVPVREIATKW